MWGRTLFPMGFLASGQTPAAPDYFPLAVGNRWEYSVTGSTERRVGEVLGSEEIAGKTWFRLRWLSEKEYWVRTDGRQMMELDRAANQETVWVDFAGPEAAPSAGGLAVCVGAPTPVGGAVFQVTRETCLGTGGAHVVYSASLGMVERTYRGFAGDTTMSLVSSRIQGVNWNP